VEKNVLERVGNSLQRPAIYAARQFLVGPTRLREGQIFRDRNKCVEAGLVVANGAQCLLRQFERRNLVRPQLRGGVFYSHSPSTAVSESVASERVIAGSTSWVSFFSSGRKASSRACNEGAIRSTASAGISSPRARASVFQSVITH